MRGSSPTATACCTATPPWRSAVVLLPPGDGYVPASVLDSLRLPHPLGACVRARKTRYRHRDRVRLLRGLAVAGGSAGGAPAASAAARPDEAAGQLRAPSAGALDRGRDP